MIYQKLHFFFIDKCWFEFTLYYIEVKVSDLLPCSSQPFSLKKLVFFHSFHINFKFRFIFLFSFIIISHQEVEQCEKDNGACLEGGGGGVLLDEALYEAYEFKHMTSREDFLIRDKLDKIDLLKAGKLNILNNNWTV